MSVTRGELEQALTVLERELGIPLGLDWAYGGVRIVSADGSRDLLGRRGSKREAFETIWTAIDAIRLFQDGPNGGAA